MTLHLPVFDEMNSSIFRNRNCSLLLRCFFWPPDDRGCFAALNLCVVMKFVDDDDNDDDDVLLPTVCFARQTRSSDLQPSTMQMQFLFVGNGRI